MKVKELKEILGEVVADEKKHLKYCKRISKKYAPNKDVLEKTLSEYREIEAVVTAKLNQNLLDYYLKEDIFNGFISKKFWQCVGDITNKYPRPYYTKFYNAEVA